MALESKRTMDEVAANWAIRLDANSVDAAAQEELDAWLAGNERNLGALLRAQAALSYLDRGRASASPDVDANVERQHWLVGRRGLIAAVTTGVAAATIAGFGLFSPRLQDVGTGIGEIRRVALADGSEATINTDSALAVAMRSNNRTVRLDRGEAWFKVAHDKARPFTVEIGALRVRAIGTAFSVRRREAGADVLVTEGVVETWVVGREASKQRIAAGSRGFVSATAGSIEVAQAPQEIDRTLSWRTGELALDGETLNYAVGEINRYNSRQIVIEDVALGREQLVGYFKVNEPENFARAIGSMTGTKVVSDGSNIRIIREVD